MRRSILLLKDFDVACTPFQRARGIMFRRRMNRPLLFVFRREAGKQNAIHSLFCFMRFDAVFLDSRKKVVDVKENIPPFRPFMPPRAPAKYLIEAPAGFARKHKISEGEKIGFSIAPRDGA